MIVIPPFTPSVVISENDLIAGTDDKLIIIMDEVASYITTNMNNGVNSINDNVAKIFTSSGIQIVGATTTISDTTISTYGEDIIVGSWVISSNGILGRINEVNLPNVIVEWVQDIRNTIYQGLNISGTVATVGELPTTATNGTAYFVGIVAPRDVYTYDTTTSSWINQGTLKGDTGQGVPTGGTTNQILSKNSNADYDCKWIDNNINKYITSLIVSNWTARTSAADNNWRSVCWSPELGIFVAVASTGTGNRVMTSPDGINWTARTSAADNSWYGVCWSPELGIFVAVAFSGIGNRVMTSPDGINWTARTSAADNNWHSVCWSPELGIFVAVADTGTGNRVMTSPDGINWTARTSAADNNWRSVCWSPELGIFVAVAYSGTGNRVMTSLFSKE